MKASDLSAALITGGLETRFIGQRVLYYPRLRTTMDVARQEALNGAPEGRRRRIRRFGTGYGVVSDQAVVSPVSKLSAKISEERLLQSEPWKTSRSSMYQPA